MKCMCFVFNSYKQVKKLTEAALGNVSCGNWNLSDLFFLYFDFHPYLQIFYPQLINITVNKCHVDSCDNDIKISMCNVIQVILLDSGTIY